VKEGEETQVLLPLNAPSDVRVSIYTTAFRKVREESFPQVGVGQAVAIELKDRSGKALANGLYYLVFVTDQGRWKVKLLIER
jgi:hypothetical protein